MGKRSILLVILIILLLASIAASAYAITSSAEGRCQCGDKGGDGGSTQNPLEFDVTFDSQGGRFDAHEGSPGSITVKVRDGGKVHTPDPPTRDGYLFDEWYAERDCVNEWDFASRTVHNDITLYAKWVSEDSQAPYETYSVAFDSQGGSAVAGLTDVREGSRISPPADPTRGGYVFRGWYKEAACTDGWDFSMDRVYEDLTLYAGWAKGYLVTFDYQKATGGDSDKAMVIDFGDQFQLPRPTRSPFDFGGWFLMVGGVNATIGDDDPANIAGLWDGQSWPYAQNMTLYAHWNGSIGMDYEDTLPGECEFKSFGYASDVSIVIPEWSLGRKVTSIMEEAFARSYYTESIYIPDTVASIGFRAFAALSNLKSVRIPDAVESIGYEAFEYCSNLEAIVLPKSLKVIEDRTFYNCIELKSVTIQSGVTAIEENAFVNCVELTSIVIPDTVTSIGVGAFADCSGLTSAVLPNKLTTIEDNLFFGCGLTSITIPSGVTGIGESAFGYCVDLAAVSIPDKVASIGNRAFESCASLTSVTIPGSVASIGDEAFSYCDGLKSVTLQSGVASIGDEAFEDCSGLTSAYVSNSVTSMGSKAFAGCSSLTSITVQSPAPHSGWASDWNGGIPYVQVP